ncbi:hypothetical protein [uncultured Tateyamaria sp.]|nr:hypothetical protein [uncultured Tateyamaria sp.]
MIDKAGGVVDAEPIEAVAAVGKNREAELVRAEKPDQHLGKVAYL